MEWQSEQEKKESKSLYQSQKENLYFSAFPKTTSQSKIQTKEVGSEPSEIKKISDTKTIDKETGEAKSTEKPKS